MSPVWIAIVVPTILAIVVVKTWSFFKRLIG